MLFRVARCRMVAAGGGLLIGLAAASLAGCKSRDAGGAKGGPTVLEIEPIDDETDVLAPVKDLPHGADVLAENVDGHAQRFIFVSIPEGTTLAQARASADALVKDHVKLPAGARMAWARNDDGKSLRSYLLREPAFITSADVLEAETGTGPQTGEPYVAVTLAQSAAARMEGVTRQNVGKRLAILIDGLVRAAPVVRAPIAGGHVTITLGKGATQDEAAALATRLRPSR